MLSDQSEPAMEISMRYIPHEVDKWELITELANILHKDPFKQSRPDRKLNFDVHLFSHEGGDRCTHTGTGILKVPSKKIGVQFLKHVGDNPVRIRRKKIAFRDNHKSPSERETAMLQKAPWVDPDAEKDREWRMFELGQGPGIRVVTVQFGVLFQDRNARPGESRKYSIEWEKDYTSQGQAWLKFEYDHKLLKIEVGDRLSKTVGSNIILYFANISKIAVGYEYGRAFIIFDTYTPPIFEEVDFYRATTDNARGDRVRFKRRIGSVEHHETHAGVAPFAHTLRLLLPNNNQSDGSDVIDKFRSLCDIAQLNTTIRLAKVEAAGWKFFSGTALRAWTAYTAKHDWPVAFQLESLLHNGILHTQELMDMSPRIEALCEKYGSDYVGDLLRRYPEFLSDPNRLSAETPAQCLERVLSKLIRLKEKTQSSASGIFQCYHAIVTPTRMLLEGPYAGDSNRIIRQYAGYEDHFLRVAFSDEDRMRLRWDREYDGHVFLEERIGGLLKGFELAGRRFEFLAYSTSALREHSVWFMNPFQHHDPSLGVITAQKIRDSIGDFQVPENVEIDPEKPPLLWCPSKYAARLAQAFTSTESSVKIHRREWDIIPDMGREPYLFTDGIGTISESLGDEIWAALCRARLNRGQRAVKPSAYQIRFLGFKGIVAIDRELDNIPGNIRMRLRPSMRKFENSNAEEADIEIALAFENPMVAYFNKALVMILEDRGVERTKFMNLLREAVADAQLVDDSLSKCQAFLALHSFGNVYHLPRILERLAEREAEIVEPHSTSSKKMKMNIDSKFLKGLRNIARMQVLKEIKHDARILIPDSHLLVGVADEGPAYVNDGLRPEFTDETTYCLSENQIYACIQRPEDKEPTWISGPCLIWRSPLVHLGDAQRVNAVGRPPAGKRNLFGHLKNVVSNLLIDRIHTGKRSLASCLGGGDLDGDTFTVSTYTGILPPIAEPAAFYPPGSDLNLGRNSTVEDIHNFIIEYFNSDVIGILSDRLLVIADQSQKGFFDPDCKKLATLCSQAVDYPKKGVRVDISGNRLPRPIIRAKPDWHAAEVIGPRKSDYYESTRALGYMYREIKPEDITLPEDLRDPAKPPEFRTERITLLLQDSVLEYLPSFDGHRKSEDIDLLFKNYVDNLRYISAIHTLSNDASVRLTEQEIVLGLILANCSERRWKRDRMYRMRTHTSNLVDETKQGFRPLGRAGNVIEDKEVLLHVLDKAWYAWTRQEVNMFGVNSFKLIALGSVLDCLEKLKSL